MKFLREMTRDERAAHYAATDARVSDVLKNMKDDLHRPISFKGCGSWQRAFMMVVQHDARINSIRVSNDGDIKHSKSLPLVTKIGKPIVRILATEIPWQPLDLGFLLIEVPGWLANDRELCQARKPLLSTALEWTDAQQAAWQSLLRGLERVRAEDKKTFQKRRYGRQAAPAGGLYSPSMSTW